MIDTLFGSNFVLCILLGIYSFKSSHTGIFFHSLTIAGIYSVFCLYIGLMLSSRYKSTYGTPLLNASRAASIYSLFISGIALIVSGMLSQGTTSLAGQHPALLYGLATLGILIVIVNLILIRYISFAIKRQIHYPVLEGCTILFVGRRRKARVYWNSISDNEKRGLRANFYNPDKTGNNHEEELQHIIESSFVEKAVFLQTEGYENLMEQCAKQGIEIWIPPTDRRTRLQVSAFTVQRNAPVRSTLVFVFNRLIALLMIIGSSPVWLIAVLGIRFSDKGPVFYQQARSGLYGKHFGMWKFRSMYTDAESRLEEIKAKYGNDMDGPIFKLENDPRIFPFGHIMRKLSIDELPQLLNVLFGDMNIVGPRPLPVYETEAFDKIEYRKRLCVLPGLTCYWQIEGRSNITDFNELIKLDYKYIDNPTLWTDIKLILKTVPAVLFAKGAK